MNAGGVTITAEEYGPHHAMHGTPHLVKSRLFRFELPDGVAEVDQTDYGHPGRWNPCHAKVIPAKLQPKTNQLVAAAEGIAALL